MRYIFKFPDIGEGIHEGKILNWYVKKGQEISSGDSLVKMETDKVVTDIPSPRAGIVAAVFGKEGEVIQVGSPLVEIEIPGVDGEKAREIDRESPLPKSESKVEEKGFGVVGTLEVAGDAARLAPSNEGTETAGQMELPEKVQATPVARAMAKEMGIDIQKIRGTGPSGRITKQDIQAYHRAPLIESGQGEDTGSDTQVKILPLSQIRKAIARNMAASKQTAAHMTVFEEVEVSGLIEMRNKYKEEYERSGTKLTYLPFILQAVARALMLHPLLNSQIDLENDRIIQKNHCHLGIAVDTEAGLMVPVLRHADRKSIFQLAVELQEIKEKALSRHLKLEDLQDGTFTVTNYGSLGGTFGVPVINSPQSAILGVGRIMTMPVVREERIEIGNVLPLSLRRSSFDRRRRSHPLHSRSDEIFAKSRSRLAGTKEVKMDAELTIIGSGPAGYTAAIRAAQTGIKTFLVEKEHIGGMCLNWGCIPTKALLESARRMQWAKEAARFGIDGIVPENLSFNWQNALKRSRTIVRKLTQGIDYLLKKNGVEIIYGEGQIKDEHTVQTASQKIETANILIATGSTPTPAEYSVPPERVIEIPRFFEQTDIPGKLAVIGHQAYAIELAQFFRLIGREVTLLAFSDRLIPDTDPFLSAFIEQRLKKDGVTVMKNPVISAIDSEALHVNDTVIPCDRIVHAPARHAVLPTSEIPFETENGFLRVNDRLQTQFPHIYAAGDVNGQNDLAHAASAQALRIVDSMRGIPTPESARLIPRNIYTWPEMAQIGPNEEELRRRGIDLRISEFPMTANGKALAEGNSEGVIRTLSEKKYGEVLGVQIIGSHATDLIAEASLLMEMEGTVTDLARTVHAHPTVSEIFRESGWLAEGHPIHK